MRKGLVLTGMLILVLIMQSFLSSVKEDLRAIYSGPASTWPRSSLADSTWIEPGILPAGPIDPANDSIAAIVELGRMLFFDTRLSRSGRISCAGCHKPEMSFADGLNKSIGHEGALNKRNAPSLFNVWAFSPLFRDGRAATLESQAFSPINSESEMGHDMQALPAVLHKIETYRPFFEKAYGSDAVDPERITGAIATFQRTLISPLTRFDLFLLGDRKAFSDRELRGLHLFRIKAGCMQCHGGPLFTDNRFHNNGFANGDPGRYAVTHDEADTGRFRTPSLRGVTRTGPWMHDGAMSSLQGVIDRYGIKTKLTGQEKQDLLVFLSAISPEPKPFVRPNVP